MKTKTSNGRVEVIEQKPLIIPDITIKELHSVIPYVLYEALAHRPKQRVNNVLAYSPHCFERSTLTSLLYVYVLFADNA
jgi:hypothetical protein